MLAILDAVQTLALLSLLIKSSHNNVNIYYSTQVSKFPFWGFLLLYHKSGVQY